MDWYCILNRKSDSKISLLIFLFLWLVLFSACKKPSSSTKNNPPDPFASLTQKQQATASYFLDIALGMEFGQASEVVRKWKNRMRIYIGGHPDSELKNELHSIVGELNKLTSESNFSIGIVSDSLNSNAYIFFGSSATFGQRVPAARGHLAQNYGEFYVWWNNSQEIYRMAMYVDMYRTDSEKARKHLLREELTQSLGLAKDSPKYMDSIFQSSYEGQTTEYSTMDKHLIQLLYQPKMETGMNKKQTENVLVKIIDKVVPGSS